MFRYLGDSEPGWLSKNWQWLVFVVMVGFAVQQFTANQSTQDKVDHAVEKERLQQQNKDLQLRIDHLTDSQKQLTDKLNTAYEEISKGLNRISQLESEKEINRLTIRLLRTNDDLVAAFRETFPAVAKAQSLGVIELEDDNGIILPYLSIPLWFAETFISEHNELAIAQKQLAEYNDITAKYGEAEDLHNQVMRLEQEKSAAWESGYKNTFSQHDELSKKYQACLNKPRFDVPNGWVIAGSIAAGFAGCTAIQGRF